MQVASNASCHVFNKYVKREIVKIVDEEKVRKNIHVTEKNIYCFNVFAYTIMFNIVHNVLLQKVKHSKLAEDIERLVNDDKQMLPAEVDSDNVT